MSDPIYGVLKEQLGAYRKNEEENRIIIESITSEEDIIVQNITGDLDVGSDAELDSILDKIPITTNKEVKITSKDLDDVSKDPNPTVEELVESLIENYLATK